MKVLVTGAGGWIGGYCIPLLKERGYDPVPYKGALEYGYVVPRSISGFPTLLHLAWETTPGVFWSSPLNRDWFLASLRLFQEFVQGGGKRIVVAGTGADTATPYGMAKDAMRRVLEAYQDAAGVSCAYGKIYYLYGPHEKPQRLVPAIIKSLLAGKEYTIGKADHQASIAHVHDVAASLVSMLDVGLTGSVEIGGDVVTLGELGRIIAAKIGRPELLTLGDTPSSPYVPLHAHDWPRKYDLHSGLDEAIQYWKR
jgi:nucleoside-diphosphate-sugar epimerase